MFYSAHSDKESQTLSQPNTDQASSKPDRYKKVSSHVLEVFNNKEFLSDV